MKTRVGVFGAHRGMSMIDVFLAYEEAELVAVCDRYVPLLDQVREKAEKAGMEVALYESFDDFIQHDMDAVVLANYATEHAPYAIRCLEKGMHVMSECMPCETMAQAVELVEAVEKSGKYTPMQRTVVICLTPLKCGGYMRKGSWVRLPMPNVNTFMTVLMYGQNLPMETPTIGGIGFRQPSIVVIL